MRALVISLLTLGACERAPAALETVPAGFTALATVTDGDTLRVPDMNLRIRLNGFDAPERGKVCGAVDVYAEATRALDQHIGPAGIVYCDLTGDRAQDRDVAVCTVGERDLGELMVSSGWARDWPRYSKGRYADEEAAARAAKLGIWALDCPVSVWSHRNYN